MINAKKAVRNVNNFKNEFNHYLEEFCNEVISMAKLECYSTVIDVDIIKNKDMQGMFLDYVKNELGFSVEPHIFDKTYTIFWRRDYITDKTIEKDGRICAYGAYLTTYHIEDDDDDKYIEEIAEDIERASLLGKRNVTFYNNNWYRMNSVIAIMRDCGYMIEHIDGDTIVIKW